MCLIIIKYIFLNLVTINIFNYVFDISIHQPSVNFNAIFYTLIFLFFLYIIYFNSFAWICILLLFIVAIDLYRVEESRY